MAEVTVNTAPEKATRLRDTKPGDYMVMLSKPCGYAGDVFVRTWSDEDDTEEREESEEPVGAEA